MDFIKIVLVAALTAIVVVVLSGLVGGNPAVGGTRFPSGLSADSTSPASGEVRGTSFQLDNGSATTSLIADKVCVTVNPSDGGAAVYWYADATGSLATSSTSCL